MSALQTISVGQIYTHYKGNQYEIIALAKHSEDLVPYVVYKGLYTDPTFGKNPVWVRPQTLFEEKVTWQGKTVPRFALVEKP